jgi:hypothetical protein
MKQCVSYLETAGKVHDSVRMEVLYNILIVFGVPMKLVRLIKTCLNKTCSRDQAGKHLSNMLPINPYPANVENTVNS